VRDLHAVVEPGASADAGVPRRPAVDRDVGTDLDVAADQHAAQLRHGLETRGGGGEPEALLADARPGVNVTRAQYGVAEHRIGADAAAWPHGHAGAHERAWTGAATSADLALQPAGPLRRLSAGDTRDGGDVMQPYAGETGVPDLIGSHSPPFCSLPY